MGWSGGWRGLNELLWKFIDIYPGSSAGLVAGLVAVARSGPDLSSP